MPNVVAHHLRADKPSILWVSSWPKSRHNCEYAEIRSNF